MKIERLESKIEGVKIFKHELHVDGRGASAEMFRMDEARELRSQIMMGYWSLTDPGESRGPHEHKYQTDRFVFFGPGDFMLHLWNKEGERHKLTVGRSNPCTVIIPPGIIHGYKNISSMPGIVINFPDQLYKGWDSQQPEDVVRHFSEIYRM